MKLLLDTHILIWWVHGEGRRLSDAQRRALVATEQASESAGISAITLWELAMLQQRDRVAIALSLDDMLRDVESHPLLRILPLTTTVAAESVRLGEDFHRDPADRIIVATARCHDLTLVTADDRIRNWGQVRVL